MEKVYTFKQDQNVYNGIQFNNKESIELMEYEFADFIVNDIIEKEQFDTKKKIIIVQSGVSLDNHDGTWTTEIDKTLRVIEGNWLMINVKTHEIFVVDTDETQNWEKQETYA